MRRKLYTIFIERSKRPGAPHLGVCGKSSMHTFLLSHFFLVLDLNCFLPFTMPTSKHFLSMFICLFIYSYRLNITTTWVFSRKVNLELMKGFSKAPFNLLITLRPLWPVG